MGWPSVLTEECTVEGVPFLALGEQATRTERQWKSFLSWMFGICGTRAVLANEGYTWIAPVSAFYPDNRQDVLFDAAPDWFEPDKLETSGDPAATVSLRPDYVALRRTEGPRWELAAVESKGTQRSLEGLDPCPTTWSEQVRNITCIYDKEPLIPSRHIVVATRASSRAKTSPYRRVQVRTWSHRDHKSEAPCAPASMTVEVARASLYGLCTNIGLHGSAESLALASRRARTERTGQSFVDPGREREQTARARQRRSGELSSRRASQITGEQVFSTQIETPRSSIILELTEPLLELVETLGDPLVSEAQFQELDLQVGLHSRRWTEARKNREDIAVGYGVAAVRDPRR